MIGVMQTKTGGPDLPPDERGNCLGACIASLLHVEVDALPGQHHEGWWEDMQAALRKLGVEMCVVDGEALAGRPPVSGWWIAVVPSRAFEGVRHAVVMRGNRVVHDPSPGGGYVVNETHVHVFEAIVLTAQKPWRWSLKRIVEVTATSALERLHRLARSRGLHMTLEQHGGRWRVGIERPLEQVNAGARPLRSYEGVGATLDQDRVEEAAARLGDALVNTPPTRGT